MGLLLAKELVLADPSEGLTVGQLPMRPLPRLAASTPLYDMLKLFEAGGSHMALLTRPHAEGGGGGDGGAGEGGGARGPARSGSMSRARSGLIVSGARCAVRGWGARSGGAGGEGEGCLGARACEASRQTAVPARLLLPPSRPPTRSALLPQPKGDTAYIIEASGTHHAGGEGDAPGCAGECAPAPPGGWGSVPEGGAVGIITIEDVIEEVRPRGATARWLGLPGAAWGCLALPGTALRCLEPPRPNPSFGASRALGCGVCRRAV